MRYCFAFLICVCSFLAKGQKNAYKIFYQHCVEIDTTKFLVNNIGMPAILIGDRNGSNYQFMRKLNDSGSLGRKTMSEIFASKKAGDFQLKPAFDGDNMGNMLFYDKTKGRVYVRERMYEEYIITEEPLPVINWTISDSSKFIKNYLCRLATANFRGRAYKAWFTTDVGIIAAPWKFFGLPGLVMQITDNKNQVNIYAERIEYPSSDAVPQFSASGKKIAMKDYYTYRKIGYEKLLKNMQAMLDNQPNMRAIIQSGEKPPKVRSSGVPYGIEMRE